MSFSFCFDTNVRQGIPSGVTEGTLVTKVRPEHKCQPRALADRQEAHTVQSRSFLHFLASNNCSDLHERLDIVVRLEQREFPCQKEKQDHPRRPNINRCENMTLTKGCRFIVVGSTSSLVSAFKQNLRGSKPSSTRSVGLGVRSV